MLVNPMKALLREISDSRTIQASPSYQGLKKELVERLINLFASWRAKGSVTEYIEGKRLLEKHYGSALPPYVSDTALIDGADCLIFNRF